MKEGVDGGGASGILMEEVSRIYLSLNIYPIYLDNLLFCFLDFHCFRA